MFREEKEIEVEGKTFIISKFPAIEGREIITGYPVSALPKIGEYARNEELMLKLMKYVQVISENGSKIALVSRALVDNHMPSWEALFTIEKEMIEYNCSFFQDGRVSNFLSRAVQKLPQLITKTLTDYLEQSSQKTKPPSTN